ncbi:MAG: hypothetical protein M1839_001243 [Geoglossum umbratile]|nr:MAG: hypothetical protein M1839_001243 [Geoglossum umbratile]
MAKRRTLKYEDYTVGWICALPDPEMVVAQAMLDEEHEILPAADLSDTNTYLLGRIGSHNVVVACLPYGKSGIVPAAIVATHMLRSFKFINSGLMVGVGGGVPSAGIRLGDVVVSQHSKKSDAVVQYDFGTSVQGGQFTRTGALNKPPSVLLNAVSKLIARHQRQGHKLAEHLSKMIEDYPRLAPNFQYQGPSNDHLFKADYIHVREGVQCEECCSFLEANVVPREPRPDDSPTVHYGTIGSANRVIRDSNLRDKWAREENIICFEMEAAGLMDIFPCLVIRGICDYSDSHKDKRWQPYAAAAAAAYAKELLLFMPGQAVANTCPAKSAPEASLQTIDEQKRSDEEKKCLQAFRTAGAGYEAQKYVNPNREPSTCLWFLENKRFLDWRDKSTSSLLWVTADPGCGKSVLSKALIDEKLLDQDPENATFCYFFFKDVSDDQRSVTRALSALLHQLFSSDKGAPLIKHALPEFDKNGDQVSSIFEVMWAIIEQVASDPESDKIVFLLDALDECQSSMRNCLITRLKDFEYESIRRSPIKPKLKFLVTSRPYWEIESEFRTLIKDVPRIELRGEEESGAIRSEIDHVIRAQVSRLSDQIASKKARDLLLRRLLEVENRTYLWLYLILDVIKRKPRLATSTIEDLMENLPDTIDKAYDAILNKSSDRKTATKLLHIIVAASRPLTLSEMGVALYITEDTRSFDDLELQGDEQFKITVRDLCGLFVSIVDNKVFLIHQTAKGFLVKLPSPRPSDLGPWKRSLEPRESQLTLAKSCIWYLSLKELENVVLQWRDFFQGVNLGRTFLEYSALNWAMHFREGVLEENADMARLASDICNSSSGRFWVWFPIYWKARTRIFSTFIPISITLLDSIVSEHLTVIQVLLEEGADTNPQDRYGRTPQFWAAEGGYEAVAQQLLERSAGLLARDSSGLIPLARAAHNGHDTVVRLLLEIGARPETKDRVGHTPLSHAARSGYKIIVQLLVEKGADLETKDENGRTPLSWAVGSGHEDVVQFLLEKGADIDTEDTNGRTLLSWAASNGNQTSVQLLLRKCANIETKDKVSGKTPLLWATVSNLEHGVRFLLEEGADLEAKGTTGRTPLSFAAGLGYEMVVRVLLEKDANLETKDENGRTPLSWAAGSGQEGVVQLLLNKGANQETKDANGRTLLSWAAGGGHGMVVRLLLEKGAGLETKDANGRTPLSWAVGFSNEATVKLLVEEGANPETKDANGRTPLSWAARFHREAMAELLLEEGANLLPNGGQLGVAPIGNRKRKRSESSNNQTTNSISLHPTR